MSSDAALATAPADPPRSAGRPATSFRVWPVVVLVGLFWLSYAVMSWIELKMFVRFVSSLAACALLTVLFGAWWWLNRQVGLADRALGFGTAVAGGIAAALLSGSKVGLMAWLLLALPIVLTVWAAWLVAARKATAPARRIGLITVLLLCWGGFAMIRSEGLLGDGQIDLRWRWSPTAEELYLAERAQESEVADSPVPDLSPRAIALRTGDWPGFRGPNRDGTVYGTAIATDWSAAPPQRLWQRRIGPAWSSMVIVGDRLFTQEQRGEVEAIVCLDAATGRDVWSHEDAVRFSDGQAGAGPRATPTFAAGRLFALGATGIMNCLDATTGRREWSRDIAADSGAKTPLWGFSSSPLVINDIVVVFAGGPGEKNLLAYQAGTGKLLWTAEVGKTSYSSPQLVTLAGEEQILFLGDRGLAGIAPTSGNVLWEHQAPGKGMPRSLQPRLVGSWHVLIGSEADFGTALVGVMRDGPTWSTRQQWESRQMAPSFNDFVVLKGSIYGFDGNIFCCVDLKNGQRRWKKGRYGNGQVLLLADQRLLFVLSDRGEGILVRADPDRHEELGRFQAITGKTWNHPVISRSRVYVRNAKEMACYELVPARKP